MLKMLLKSSILALALSILSTFSCLDGQCDTPSGNLHIRGGLVSGRFSGSSDSANGSLSIANSLDLEYETLQSRHLSYLIRGILSYSISTGVFSYGYTGVGLRYYLWSNSKGYRESESGTVLSKQPLIRFYIGPEIGISHAVIKQYTTVIQTNSAFLELGANTGAIYQLAKGFNIEAQIGYFYGLGISSVGVGATIFKGLVGVGFYF